MIKKSKPLLFPKAAEANYRNRLLNIVKFVETQIKVRLLPLLPSLFLNSSRKDDVLDEFERVMNEIRNSTEYQLISKIEELRVVVSSISNFSLRQVAKALSSRIKIEAELVDINIFSSPLNADLNLLIKSWVYTNTRLIKSIPENLLNDVALVVQTGFSNGASIDTITEQIKKKFNVSENRARLIARDQTAKLNGNIAKHEFKKAGHSNYQWVTSGDERVRTSHKALNNKICTWDNPTIYKDSVEGKWKMRKSIGAVEKDVGEDFQCRCTMVIILD